MKRQLLLIFFLSSSFYNLCNCMDNKDSNEQMKEPEFIMLNSRDTIVEDLIIPDNGDIFGWATYRNHDQDYGDMCDYIVTTNYSPKLSEEETKE